MISRFTLHPASIREAGARRCELRRPVKLILTTVLMSLASAAQAQWQPILKKPPAIAKQDNSETAKPALVATVKDGFTIIAGGDLLGPYHPRFTVADPDRAAVFRIFQSGDVGFANLEGNLFDTWKFTGSPAAENGGFEQGGIGSGPVLAMSVATDLRKLGINLVSTANNHALDWGLEGLVTTLRNLDEAGIAHAGSGHNLFEARGAAFLETSHGRVALIGSASTFMPMAPAGAGGGDGRLLKAARPGISALRSRPIALVTAAELETLRRIAQRQGKRVDADDTEVTLAPNEAVFIQQSFRKADHTGLTYELQPDDRAGILTSIRAGKEGADSAIYTIHAQETDSGGQEFDAEPASLHAADFLQPLFHDAVDAGADVVLTHGPHVLRGIEIYQGKPIFYSMGSLFFELGRDWRPEWYDSIVAAIEFKGGQVSEIRLYPIVLGTPSENRTRDEQGVPHLAKGADAARILTSLQKQSSVYGTKILIQQGVGYIRP
jgi:poly-gamma-glutamate capsule biosynthesis protein CapA/YwtB (metallophosphatase superfamily)